MTTPLSMPVTSRCGVVSVLPSRSAPVFSSNAATSVKVPPTSADRRIAESRNGHSREATPSDVGSPSYHAFIRACAGRSVMKLCAGACAMKNGSLAFSAALCGVTPQAQKTGTIPSGVGGTGPPNSGSVEIGADRGRIAEMNWRAVIERKARRDLRGGDCLLRGEPAHGDDHVTAKRTRRLGRQGRCAAPSGPCGSARRHSPARRRC